MHPLAELSGPIIIIIKNDSKNNTKCPAHEPFAIGEWFDLDYAASKFIYASFTIWPFFIAKYSLHLPNLMRQSSTQ